MLTIANAISTSVVLANFSFTLWATIGTAAPQPATPSAVETALKPNASGTNVPVTVIESKLDGCRYLLRLGNGETLEAVLPKQYQKDGLKLVVSYVARSGGSICMSGTLVTLTAVAAANVTPNPKPTP